MKPKGIPYGEWLKWVMKKRQMTKRRLIRRSGVEPERFEALMSGKVPPEEAKEEVYLIAEGLLTNRPVKQMDLILDSLGLHMDLAEWQAKCGECCTWNIAID